MPGIGDTLREARMRQRVDITELEESTKIRAKYLRALENEEFGLLPGPTYVKSFLRTYAEKLGLDAQLLVEEYRAQYEAPEPVEFQPIGAPAPEVRRRPPGLGAPPGRGMAVAAGVIALVAFLLVLGLTGGSDEPAPRVDTGPGATTPAADAPAEPEPEAPPERVVMRVVPVDATYVCVDRGAERPVFEGTLEEPRTFRAAGVLRVNLGKRSAQLRVDGEPVAFEIGPEPIGFAFRPGGRQRELPPGERPCV